MIRWTRGDKIRLGKAVAEFNREIAKNEKLQDQVTLPEKINYKDLRDSIQTREGLKYYINTLKRIELKGAFQIETLDNGEKITRYEKREIERGRRNAIKYINQEIKKLEDQTKINLGVDADIKLPAAFKSLEQKSLEAKIRDYKELYKLHGVAFKTRAKELGISYHELQYRRAFIFRQNYMAVMREKYHNFENFKKFEAWARKHKNPISFYNALPDDEYYPNDLTYQSDKVFTQAEFNAFLQVIGIDIE